MYDFSKFMKFNARKDYDNNKFQAICLYESVSEYKDPDIVDDLIYDKEVKEVSTCSVKIHEITFIWLD